MTVALNITIRWSGKVAEIHRLKRPPWYFSLLEPLIKLGTSAASIELFKWTCFNEVLMSNLIPSTPLLYLNYFIYFFNRVIQWDYRGETGNYIMITSSSNNFDAFPKCLVIHKMSDI